MIVLALETATDGAGAALADETGVRAVSWSSGRRRHAESLAPAVLEVLDRAGLSLPDLHAVAVDVGPGLFTGVRVGVAAAQGLARGEGIGILALSSLDVLARAAAEACWPGPVVSIVDARRGELFAAHYPLGALEPERPGPAARAHRVPSASPPGLFTPSDLGRDLSALASTGLWGPAGAAALAGLDRSDVPPGASPGGHPAQVLVVGDGARRYQELFSSIPGVVVAGPRLSTLDPALLAGLAVDRLAAGAALVPPAAVRPLYLREPDARANWVQRPGERGPLPRESAGSAGS